jgi:hypothetical protein
MMLYVRMALYFLFPILASQGLVIWNEEAGTVTFQVEDLVVVIMGVVGFVMTFITSRFATKK